MLITRIVPLQDQNVVFVHLASFDWDFTLGKAVKLFQGDDELRGRQVGSGNHEGHAAIKLVMEADWAGMIATLQKMERSGQPIWLEFR